MSVLKLDTAYRDVNSGALFLSWSDNVVGATHYTLEVSYSQPIGDDWELLAQTTNPFVSDFMSRKAPRFFDEKYYRIRALSVGGEVLGELLIPDNVKNERPIVDQVKNLLMHTAENILRNTSWGYDAFIVKPRRAGTPCSCHQQELRSSTDPDCEKCFGTGYIGGYYNPIPTRIKIHTEQINMSTVNAPIPTQYDNVQMVIPAIVKVFPGDYVIIPDLGYRYVCVNSNVDSLTSVKTATQMSQMSRADEKDPFYKYHIDDMGVVVTSSTCTATDVSIKGKNLFPLFGSVELVFGLRENDLDAVVFSQFDLIKATQTELIFTQRPDENDTPLVNLLTELHEYDFRLILNGKFIEGTSVPTP